MRLDPFRVMSVWFVPIDGWLHSARWAPGPGSSPVLGQLNWGYPGPAVLFRMPLFLFLSSTFLLQSFHICLSQEFHALVASLSGPSLQRSVVPDYSQPESKTLGPVSHSRPPREAATYQVAISELSENTHASKPLLTLRAFFRMSLSFSYLSSPEFFSRDGLLAYFPPQESPDCCDTGGSLDHLNTGRALQDLMWC